MFHSVILLGLCAPLVFGDTVAPNLPVVNLGYVGGTKTEHQIDEI